MNKKLLSSFFVLALISLSFWAPAAIAHYGGKQCPIKGGYGGSDCSGGKCSMRSHKGGGCPIVGKTLWLAHEALENKEAIGLSSDQVNAIKELKLEVKKQMIQQKAAMQIGMLEMESKLKAENFDAEGLKAMIDEGMAAMATNAKASIDQYAKLRSILKEDQIVKLKALKKK